MKKKCRIVGILIHTDQEESLQGRKSRRSCKRLFQAALIFTLLLSKAYSQPIDYTVQANIIYRFTKYIDWPEDKKSGDFVIGIWEDNPLLYDELKAFLGNKTVGNQKIVLRKVHSAASVLFCHILFLGDDESSNLKKITAFTAGLAILVLTESEGLGRQGSCINFILVDDHLKLEINKGNIEKRNLGIASELLQLGIPVK